MPELNVNDLTKALKDALYIGVGAGVIALQKVQVQRQELQKQIKPLLGDARNQLDKVTETVTDTVEEQVKVLEDRLDSVENQVDDLLDRLEEQLPEQAAEIVKQIRDAAKDAREQVLALVNRAA